jgi:hypothetical protein
MLDLQRLPDWRVRLDDMINDVRRKPFEWGAMDCGPAFTGRAVEAITSVNYLAAFIGGYSTVAEAVALMEGEGFTDLADLVASLLPEHEHASQAKVGDIAAVPTDGPFGWSLGIVGGERIFAMHKVGLVTVDFLTAKRAFRVG